ncbi:hypothetical protein [Luteimonas salinisoli]|uniref:hypothetical protein n=1 Tax=Luteimonas salinisoli TaxID=2752307 RepID=UPI001C5C956E|nr:hypothetical protein [Luteimonas salinisoli]
MNFFLKYPQILQFSCSFDISSWVRSLIATNHANQYRGPAIQNLPGAVNARLVCDRDAFDVNKVLCRKMITMKDA